MAEDVAGIPDPDDLREDALVHSDKPVLAAKLRAAADAIDRLRKVKVYDDGAYQHVCELYDDADKALKATEAEVERLTKERDELSEGSKVWASKVRQLIVERDGLKARADRAEQDADRLFQFVKAQRYGLTLPGEYSGVFGHHERAVALRSEPADPQRLVDVLPALPSDEDRARFAEEWRRSTELRTQRERWL